MTHRVLNRTLASALLVSSQVLFLLTMAPTLSFWDCGEFIAASYTLGIPHPPGAPLYLLLGRLFSMIPLFGDVGARVNLISTIASSVTVMLTYLITVRMVMIYRRTPPETWSTSDKIAIYGGSVVGALALAFSDSFWFNAVEAEVYALSSCFTAFIFWLLLRWYDEEPAFGHDRWLILVMYIIGLSIGVHLLSLLMIFAVALIYYFKKYTVSIKSLFLLTVASVLLFLTVYIGIIKGLPKLLELMSWPALVLVLVLLCTGIWLTHRYKRPLSNTILLSFLVIIIGYTSYGMIFVRANAGPPINENHPATAKDFFYYLNRDQYGDMPLWPRRWSPEPVHQESYALYSSDLDYFVRYQLDKMYLRYFGWQFIGREHDMEGAVVDWQVLWGLPFLVGLFGAVSQFRKEWKTGSVVLSLFLLSGAALVVYLNQTEPQPRERDYSYVGSFFAFALWIGIGTERLVHAVATRFGPVVKGRLAIPAAATLVLLLLLLDGRMLVANYRVHDRSGNYMARDWAYNILQNCPKDAILFTNGDNDTFPLWYLQEVERVRTDIRIVNLSLANTGWYLKQLKNSTNRGSASLRFSQTDDELEGINYVPIDSINVTLPAQEARRRLSGEMTQHGLSLPGPLLDSINWELKPGFFYRGQGYLRPQDIAVYDIILNNFSDRPICFALTVDPASMIGLQHYVRFDGLVYRLVPIQSKDPMSFVDPVIFYRNIVVRSRYTNIDNPRVNFEETSRRLIGNYPPLFYRLALELGDYPDEMLLVDDAAGHKRRIQRYKLAIEVLDAATKKFPLEQYPRNPELAGAIISLYASLGEKQKTSAYITYLEALSDRVSLDEDPRLYFVLAEAYRDVGRLDDAARIVGSLARKLNDPGLINEFEKK